MTPPAPWTHQVRRADRQRRRYLREALIALNAVRELSHDTGQTRFAFEAVENFPALDFLDYTTRRLPLLGDPRFVELYEARSMPDLTTAASLARLETHAPGTLGHEYARYVQGRQLDNLFLEYLEVESPLDYFAYRTAHLHDLFHFILGYEAFDPIGEMEIEAFLYAQSGAHNHTLFLLGYVVFLLRNDPGQLWAGRERLRAAYRLGARVPSLLLVRWEDQLARPLVDVRRELGIAQRPLSRANLTPTAPPRLSHVALNVQSRARAEHFYSRVYGYTVSARDERLGVTFMTSGDDHHTLALQEAWPTGPLSTLRGIVKNAPRVAGMVRARLGDARSSSGKKTVIPPLRIAWAHLAPGLSHVGYRVRDLAELRAYRHSLRSAGVKVDWAVNHNDLVKGLYFRDQSGNFCELFVDGDEVRAMQAEVADGASLDRFRIDDFKNYELDLDAELGSDA